MPARLVRDIIKTQTVLTLPAAATIRQAAQKMMEWRVGAVLVVDHHGRLVGIFTERDALFRVLAADINPDTTTLAMVMTPRPVTITADRRMAHALRLMHDQNCRHIPVVDLDVPVGVVSLRDALGPELTSFEKETSRKAELGEILG